MQNTTAAQELKKRIQTTVPRDTEALRGGGNRSGALLVMGGSYEVEIKYRVTDSTVEAWIYSGSGNDAQRKLRTVAPRGERGANDVEAIATVTQALKGPVTELVPNAT